MADIISRLKLESGEFDSKIKRASQELTAYSQHCRKMGLEMGYANKDAKEFAKSLGSMQTTATTARGKVSELSDAFVNLKAMYNQMTDAEKQGQFGKNLAASLDQLKVRLNDAKKDLTDVQQELNDMGKADGSKFGQFGNVLDTLGSKLGVTGNLTEMLTSKTALMTAGIGASVAIIGKATSEWAKYNAELSKQDQITTVTTGLDGAAGNKMTDQARALVDTYNVDFREVINAANTLMTQFGKSGDDAMSLIRQGMQGMIQGDGPKLLSMIQQYAPSFRDAGISASQLVAIIHNSEGGLFTDANMNAIVMGIKNIRLMTKATSDALAKMGINGQEMTRKLNDGSMTIFEAMQQVSNAINRTGSSSQAAGEVMQQVFGRQGAAAGTKLGEAIATLNTNLDETKVKTGELGKSFDDLYEANVRLNTAIRDAFGYDGWEQMANGIKSKLVSALATVIDQLGKIRQWFNNFTPGGQTENTQSAEQKEMNRRLAYVRSGSNKQYWHQQNQQYYDQQVSDRQFKVAALKGNDAITKGLRQKAEADLQAWKNLRDEYQKKANAILNAPPKTDKTDKTNPATVDDPKGSQTSTKTEQTELQKNQAKINALTQQFVDINAEASRAGKPLTEEQKKQTDEIQKQIEKLKQRNGLLNLFAERAQGRLLSNDDMKRKAEIDIQAFVESIGKPLGEGLNKTPGTLLKAPETEIPRGGLQLSDKAMKAVGKNTNKHSENGKEDDPFAKFSQDFSRVTSSVSSIAGGINQLGIELPQGIEKGLGIMQGISSILTGILGLVALIKAATDVAAGASVWDAIFPFARGGIVPAFANGGLIGKAAGGMLIPGNSYSGDNLRMPVDGGRGFIGVNSGELVLNRSQQFNLASQLQGNGMQGLNLTATIKGEQIRLALNNNGRRTGKGEYVQTNRR